MTDLQDNPTYAVDPSRLSTGSWSHELGRQIGRGDIHASYSADRICTGQPVRSPFAHVGYQWVCVSFGPGATACAYRLVHPSAFEGVATTYANRAGLNGGDDARADPMGFYHGVTVRSAGREFVLSGPPTRFIAGQESQLSLF